MSKFRQVKETSRAMEMVVARPDYMTIFSGLTHPSASLYDKYFNFEEAETAHKELKKVLHDANKEVKIHDVMDVLQTVDLEKLRKFAATYLQYYKTDTFASSGNGDGMNSKILLSAVVMTKNDQDKKDNLIACASRKFLIDLILNYPKIMIQPTKKNTGIEALSYVYNPVTNLTFSRDQQITTATNIIMGKMSTSIRERERPIMKFIFEQGLKMSVKELVGKNSLLEGGDFFPISSELCLIGIGLRTNMAAVMEIMINDWFGTDYVAVVKDCFDLDMDRMHLDTVFNVVTEKTVVVVEGLKDRRQRLVDLYHKNSGDIHSYHLQYADIDFYEFLEKWMGLNIIYIPDEMQKNYGINFLNMGDNKLVVVNKKAGDFIQQETTKLGEKMEIFHVNYDAVTGMYGGPHCSIQVITRQPPVETKDGEVEDYYRRNFSRGDFFFNNTNSEQYSASASSFFLVSPSEFNYNVETSDNTFTNKNTTLNKAMEEFINLRKALIKCGCKTITLLNPDYKAVDAVYPNNWISFHNESSSSSTYHQTTLVIHSMKNPSRRREIREEFIQIVAPFYPIKYDYRNYYKNGQVLEGTGSLVLDRPNRFAYSVLSERCAEPLVNEFARNLGYKLIIVKTTKYIYHTNVLMSIGPNFVIICLDIVEPSQRDALITQFKNTKKEIIAITEAQMNEFCGNVLLVNKSYLFMSSRAFSSFTIDQLNTLTKKSGLTVVNVDLATIENKGGGGVRCCLAEIYC